MRDQGGMSSGPGKSFTEFRDEVRGKQKQVFEPQPCPRFNSFFGCAFEPRYDKGPMPPEVTLDYRGVRLGEVLDAYRQITYVRDVCVRCGRTIERIK